MDYKHLPALAPGEMGSSAGSSGKSFAFRAGYGKLTSFFSTLKILFPLSGKEFREDTYALNAFYLQR
jgi:hypothetical protein